MWLSIDEKDSRPLYLQIINQIKEQVSRGFLKTGDELPSVRELADSLGINLHTVRSAYLKLREEGIIDLRLGRRAKIARLEGFTASSGTLNRLEQRTKELVTDARLSGLSEAEIRALFEQQLDGKGRNK
jgi:GntR family transcriptional regulator